jgi:hypothetical protein
MLRQSATSMNGFGPYNDPSLQSIAEAFRQLILSMQMTPSDPSSGPTHIANAQNGEGDGEGETDGSGAPPSVAALAGLLAGLGMGGSSGSGTGGASAPQGLAVNGSTAPSSPGEGTAAPDGLNPPLDQQGPNGLDRLFSEFEHILRQLDANGGVPSQPELQTGVADASGGVDTSANADTSADGVQAAAAPDNPVQTSDPPAPPDGPVASAPPPSPTSQAVTPPTTPVTPPPSPASQSGTPPTTPESPSAPADKNVILDPAQVTGPKAGTGPNATVLKNSFDHPITLGQFTNGGSTTVPTASITLQPGQTGVLSHMDGEGGFIAKADASGHFQPNASRLEFKTDADGKMSWPDASDIDGRNAAIWFTDGKQLTKGDTQSISGGAPTDTVSADAAGDKTIAGYYDGSTATMRDGGAYMTGKLGTGGTYQHPNDDTLGPGQNPMGGTNSKVISAIFAPP